jgi:hypothetical protein
MKSLKAVGLIVLIFAAGFVGGVYATHIFLRRMVQYAVAHPNQIRTNIEQNIDQRLFRRLGVDPVQREQVHDILRDSRERMRDVREQFQPMLNTISLETRTNIYAVLKPDQQDRFAAFLEENRQFLPIRELPPPRRQTNAPIER